MRVLIVEDELLIAINLEQYLEDWGYQVCALAHDADEAFEKAAQLHPDVLLMDVRLANNSSGIEAARRILEAFHIPSVFVTGNLDQDTVAKINPLNPLGLVPKPIDEWLLRTALEVAEHRIQAGMHEEGQGDGPDQSRAGSATLGRARTRKGMAAPGQRP